MRLPLRFLQHHWLPPKSNTRSRRSRSLLPTTTTIICVITSSRTATTGFAFSSSSSFAAGFHHRHRPTTTTTAGVTADLGGVIRMPQTRQQRYSTAISAVSGKRTNGNNNKVSSPPAVAISSLQPSTPKRRRKRQNSDEDSLPTVIASSAAAVTPSPKKKAMKSNKKQKSETSVPTTAAKTSKKTTKKKSATTTTAVIKKQQPPKDWEHIYSLVEELRQDRTAPCDESGCEALPDPSVPPEIFRFQVLISLMLSSQTKDAVVGEAIRALQRDKVLNVHAIHAMDFDALNSYIRKVGFHNNKTKYILQTAQILLEQYQGDLPPTAALMIRDLPGVGPKMAYICENVAWNRQSGIGVDTHMHRLFGLLGWVKGSKTPEQTRVQLESWLPKDKWADVNILWVGFGQEVQQFKPRSLRKALDCSRPADALALLKRCGLDYRKEAIKCGIPLDEIETALQEK